jgi:hypothetical protein
MTLTLELPDDLAERLAGLPDNTLRRWALDALTAYPTPADGRALTPKDVLALPKAERDQLMREAAEAMAPLYEADLALPPHERELTAFTALDGVDKVLEPEEYLAGAH